MNFLKELLEQQDRQAGTHPMRKLMLELQRNAVNLDVHDYFDIHMTVFQPNEYSRMLEISLSKHDMPIDDGLLLSIHDKHAAHIHGDETTMDSILIGLIPVSVESSLCHIVVNNVGRLENKESLKIWDTIDIVGNYHSAKQMLNGILNSMFNNIRLLPSDGVIARTSEGIGRVASRNMLVQLEHEMTRISDNMISLYEMQKDHRVAVVVKKQPIHSQQASTDKHQAGNFPATLTATSKSGNTAWCIFCEVIGYRCNLDDKETTHPTLNELIQKHAKQDNTDLKLWSRLEEYETKLVLKIIDSSTQIVLDFDYSKFVFGKRPAVAYELIQSNGKPYHYSKK